MSDLFGNHIVGFPTMRLIYISCLQMTFNEVVKYIYIVPNMIRNEQHPGKTNKYDFGPGPTQTDLYSHRIELEA